MKIINTFLLFFFSTALLAQNVEIDSLENVLLNHTEDDTVKVNLLNSLAVRYNGNDVNKAEEKATAANTLAKQLGYTNGVARSTLMFGEIHTSKGEFDEALDDCLEARSLYEEMNSSKGLYYVYNTLGSISFYKNEPDEALKYFEKGLEMGIETNNLSHQAGMLNNIGNISYAKGDLGDAIIFFEKSIAIRKKTGEKKRMLRTLNNVSAIYSMQGRTIEALESLNKNLLIQREDNNKEGIATVTANISGVYWDREQPEKALAYLQESISLFKELEDKLNMAKCLVNMGNIYVALKDYPKALDCFTKALAIYKANNNKDGLVSCYNQMGGLYLDMEQPEVALSYLKPCLDLSLSLENKSKNCYAHISLADAYIMLGDYSKALPHAIAGKKIADDLEFLKQQKEVSSALSKIYEATGDVKQSLKYFKLHKVLNDSIFNKENVEKIAQIEYELKYKQQLDSASIRELKLTQTVNTTAQNLAKSQRNLLLGVIGFLLMSLILGGIIFFLKLRHAKSKAQNVIMEQKLLRSQMTPHFVFNSLSVLQGMILNKEDKKSILYLSKFSKLLRITLENSRDKTVSLSQELKAIENYLELQNLEVNESYQYTISVDDNIDTSSVEIPPMLIQPFIENAIEHAFKDQKENRKIDVQLKYSNKELVCTITDNGIGIDAQKENEKRDKKSLATTITSERLEMLSKDFKMKGTISIEDRQKYNEQGTIVTLIIPYKNYVVK